MTVPDATPGPRRTPMLHLAISLAVAGVALWLFFRWFERANVYHPSRTFRASASDLGRPWQPVSLTTSDGIAIGAWFFPPPTRTASPPPIVLICHGNGGNIGDRLDLYLRLLNLGLGVLAFDYRGYGTSSGRPSEDGTYRDAASALDWLRSRGHPGSSLLVYGESLGGGVATELALRNPDLRALILQSTFTSVPDLGRELFPWLPVRTLATIRYDTRSKLPHVRIPVLVLHSREDTLIHFHHAESNTAAAGPNARLRVISGDHNDAIEASPDAFDAALRELLALPPAPPPPRVP